MITMKVAPLARYKDDLVAFTHDLTPLRLEPAERQALAQFENGYRRGLGLSAWNPDGLCRVLYLSYAIITWRTLCFPQQCTGVYAKSQKKAQPWIRGYSIFVAQCDQLIRHYLRFGAEEPRVTIDGDDFWRVLVFNPNESELESAKHWLTNVVYYDFDKIPSWLINATQDALHRPTAPETVTIGIFLDAKRRNFPPCESKPDGPSDAHD